MGTKVMNASRPIPVFLLFIALGLVAWVVLSPDGRSRDVAPRVKCGSNLRQIGQACLLYCNDHHGHYPTSMGAMQEEDIGNDVFLCPSCDSHAPTTAPANWVDVHADYKYVGMGLDSTVPAEVVVAYEPLTNHAGEGSNVLFGDGHVEWVDAISLPAAFAASDRARQTWEAGRAGAATQAK